jgi:replicative DNA helicase
MSEQLDFFTESNFIGQSNVDLEEIVLATFVNFPDTYYRVADQLSINEFSTMQTKYIYSAVRELSHDSKVDIVLVTDYLTTKKYVKYVEDKKKGFDLIVYLNDICERIDDDEHLLEHIKLLNGYARRRALMLLSDKVNESCNEMVDPMLILGAISEKIIEIQEMGDVEEFDVEKALNKAIEYQDNSDTSHFIRSYITELDLHITGFEPHDLVILAAAPSMGKTSLALEIFKNNIISGIRVAMFSLEMSQTALINRVIASDAFIPLKSIRNKCMTNRNYQMRESSMKRLGEQKWWIDDKSRSITKICNKIRKYFIRYGVKFFIIDYLQLMTCDIPGANNREQEIAKMSRMLKEIASELGVVVMALSQINRAIHGRANKRPTLGDLRESGAIEQDADTVIFVHRPAYFQIENGIPPIETAEIIIAKGRNTGMGSVETYFISELTKFCNNPYNEKELEAYTHSQRNFENYRDPSQSNSYSD